MNDPIGYYYGGPDSISQMMMNFAAQQIESIHVASFSLGGWKAGMIAHNLANRPRGSSQDRWIAATIAEKGLRFNEDKTAIVDRNGKVYATPSQGILAAASGGSTQAAGSSAGGVSSNGALTDVLGGGVNEGTAIARDWSTEGSPVDYFTVSDVGGASGMDSSMSLMCGLKCQIHGIIHGWGSKSTLSVNTVYYGIQAIDYAMMIGNPTRWATRGVVKTPVIGPVQIGVAKKVDITTPYKRPSGATNKKMRDSVQGKPCVKCGATTDRQVAGHKKALVEEYCETGAIDKQRMRSLDAIQPECPICSAKEGAEMARFSRQKKEELGL